MAHGSNYVSFLGIFMYWLIILSMFPVFISTMMSGCMAEQPCTQSFKSEIGGIKRAPAVARV